MDWSPLVKFFFSKAYVPTLVLNPNVKFFNFIGKIHMHKVGLKLFINFLLWAYVNNKGFNCFLFSMNDGGHEEIMH